MSVNIDMNRMQIEAIPFIPDKPFINPDKAIIRHRMPFRANFQQNLRWKVIDRLGKPEATNILDRKI